MRHEMKPKRKTERGGGDEGALKRAKTSKGSPAECADPSSDHLRGVWLLAEVTAYYPERSPAVGCVCRTTAAPPGRTAGTSEHFRFPATALPAAVSRRWESRDSEPWRGVRVRFHYDGYDECGRMLAADVEPVTEVEEAKIKAEKVKIKAEPPAEEEEVKTKIKAEPSAVQVKAEPQRAEGESKRKSWRKVAKHGGRLHDLSIRQQHDRLSDLRDEASTLGAGSETALATLCAALSPPCLLADVREDQAALGAFQESVRGVLADIIVSNDAEKFAAMSLFQEGLCHVQQLIQNWETEAGSTVSKAADKGRSWKQLKKAVSKLVEAG